MTPDGWADSEGNIGTVGIKPIFDYPRVDGVCIIGTYPIYLVFFSYLSLWAGYVDPDRFASLAN